MDSILRMAVLARKELAATLRDPRGRITLVVPVILQTLIFGYAATYDLSNVPYSVLDRDRSDASRELLARLDGSGIFHRVENLVRREDLLASIDDRRALLALEIDQDFARCISSGMPARIAVIGDGRNSNTAGTALSYVNSIVEGFNADSRLARGLPGAPVQVELRSWFNPNLETRWNLIPGLIGTLTLIQTLLLTALSVAREREQGTFDQLLVSPFRPAEIMAGKSLAAMFVGAVQATCILLVAHLWFRIPFAGSFLTLGAGLGLFLLAAVGIGLLVSSLAATMQQAMLFSFVVMIPCILLSGLTTPLTAMPEILQTATVINPMRYTIEIAHRVYLEGATLEELKEDLWPLGLIGGATITGSVLLFRWRPA